MAKPGDLLKESYAPDCPGRDVLDHVVSKWGMLIMLALAERTYRYAELRRRVGGVSERMLALTLRTLEEDGFVARRDHGEVPPRVDYSLTPLGSGLAEHLDALGRWIATNTPKVLAAREKHRQRAAK
ncbi:helix-turn-helix domain-containing protein [Corallococcus sp. AS-1-12]|uniref:winged helix-turn-helix transcriptional regulator n=1 Tax=Corallococcus sp. AS-1-12 TaxID=2874598 RepID=UPI001CBEFB97|nr:helix-turn-helix domain-containing protein [Corallococcus sp. AS-1-12]MBZ4336101.1 helix-turn-helix transcriptional regulator [Corallococcus sp. AS-1-12]